MQAYTACIHPNIVVCVAAKLTYPHYNPVVCVVAYTTGKEPNSAVYVVS